MIRGGCTCSEYQLYQVGCECGYEEAVANGAKDKVTYWPRGYAHPDGPSVIGVPAGMTEEEILRYIRDGDPAKSFVTICSITRFVPWDRRTPSVSEEDAAYYRKGDNS